MRFKADLSKKTPAGETVIETAMKQNRWDMAHWLLDQGAHYLNDEDREILSRIALQNNQEGLFRRIKNPSVITSTTVIGEDRASLRRPQLSSADKERMVGVGVCAAIVGCGALLITAISSHNILEGILLAGILPGIPLLGVALKAADDTEINECQNVFRKYPFIKRKTGLSD